MSSIYILAGAANVRSNGNEAMGLLRLMLHFPPSLHHTNKTLTDRHARSRRRATATRGSHGDGLPLLPQRRGRIDPMGRMWPVGDDHATTGGSSRAAPWPPNITVPLGPQAACLREAAVCGWLFGSQPSMAARRLVPSASAPIGRGRIRNDDLLVLSRVIFRFAAWQRQTCWVPVAAACEGHSPESSTRWQRSVNKHVEEKFRDPWHISIYRQCYHGMAYLCDKCAFIYRRNGKLVIEQYTPI